MEHCMPVIHRVRVDVNIPGHPTHHRLRVKNPPPPTKQQCISADAPSLASLCGKCECTKIWRNPDIVWPLNLLSVSNDLISARGEDDKWDYLGVFTIGRLSIPPEIRKISRRKSADILVVFKVFMIMWITGSLSFPKDKHTFIDDKIRDTSSLQAVWLDWCYPIMELLD